MIRALVPRDVALAAALLAGGILAGLLAHRLILARVKARAATEGRGGDDILIRAGQDIVLVWLAAGGAYLALLTAPLRPGVSSTIGRVLLLAVVVSATLALARAAGDAIRLYALRTDGTTQSSSIFINISRIAILTVGLLIVLQALDIPVAPILTALGVGGLAVALALQDTLSNLFAGIHLIASKKVRPGQFVRLDSGEEGYVTDINWRNTSIRQLPNNMVIVPNARLAASIITNTYQPEREMAVLVEVGVSYESELAHVEQVTIDVASEVMREVPGGVAGFQPFIRYHTFSDHSVDFTVILRAREFVDQYLIKHEFVKRLHARYRREGVEIPFPIRTLVFKDRPRDGRLALASAEGGNEPRPRSPVQAPGRERDPSRRAASPGAGREASRSD